METTIKIKMDNAAFDDDPSVEVARILRDLAKKIDGHPHFSPGFDCAILDQNGNEVGYCQVKEGE
jgi:hypothetical protein